MYILIILRSCLHERLSAQPHQLPRQTRRLYNLNLCICHFLRAPSCPHGSMCNCGPGFAYLMWLPDVLSCASAGHHSCSHIFHLSFFLVILLFRSLPIVCLFPSRPPQSCSSVDRCLYGELAAIQYYLLTIVI